MINSNSFLKFLKNINKSINSLLEKNLNKLNFNNLRNLSKNNIIILTFAALIVLFISYLLLPTFYKQEDISNKLKNELLNKFNLNFESSKDLNYNLFPKPHFATTDSVILDGQDEISKIKNIKIYISLANLFSLKDIEVKNLILENANFNFNKKNYNFFLKLLNNSYVDRSLKIKNSNIFFRDFNQEVLLINKILDMKYYYDPKELKSIIYVENEIFNIPFSVEAYLDNDEKKIFSKLNINFLKLQIVNELSFKDKIKLGKSEFIFNKLKSTVNYKIKKNLFEYNFFDKLDNPKFSFKGKFNFKPFYSRLDGNTDELKLSNLLNTNALIAQLLKTEIFNNKNIDFKLNVNAKTIYNNLNFKNINLKSKIQESLIDIDNTEFDWKNFAHFNIKESLIYVKNGELVLDGKLEINIKNYYEIYKFLLTPKNYRNEIKKIDLNFSFNFDQKIANLKDIKLDGKINQNVNKILNNLILKEDKLQNKIYFKNLLNKAIKNYSG